MLQESEDIMNMNKPTVDRALLFCVLQDDFTDFSVVCYVSLVYPRPHFGLLSRGEAVRDRDEPAQYILACGLRKQPRSFLMGVIYIPSGADPGGEHGVL